MKSEKARCSGVIMPCASNFGKTPRTSSFSVTRTTCSVINNEYTAASISRQVSQSKWRGLTQVSIIAITPPFHFMSGRTKDECFKFFAYTCYYPLKQKSSPEGEDFCLRSQ